RLGDRGVLVLKDVTTLISADRNIRAQILAALREIYDGRWTRNVGLDGGKTLVWPDASSSLEPSQQLGIWRTRSSRPWEIASCASGSTPSRTSSARPSA